MTSLHALVVRYANAFALHVIVSSIVLAVAIAASYLPRLSARTRFAVIVAGLAKFLLPASLLAPFIAKPIAITVIRMNVPRIVPAVLRPAPAPAATPLDWLIAFAIAVAFLFFLATIIGGLRTVAAAIRTGLPAAAREVAALNAARKRIGIRHAIDIVRSPISEAPAVLRVLRPVIVLPGDGAETLDDDELESLLCHECAHVARRDNLLAVGEAFVRSLFWFNPLVWLAHRRLSEEREKACDEIVADNAQRAETYAQALVKMCQAILARPVAGVSCMASAHLKQRMEHIMRSHQSSAKAVWHVAVTALSIVFLFAAVAATAAINNGAAKGGDDPYRFILKVGKIGPDLYRVSIDALDRKTSITAWASRPLRVKAGEPFTVDGSTSIGGEAPLAFHAEGRVAAEGHVTARAEVMRGSELVQRTNVAAVPKDSDRYTGQPISMNLAGADIRDVLATFAKLTGIEIVPDPDVQGKINVDMTDVPWDQALDEILADHGYTWRMDGNRMTVSRR